MQRQSQNYKRRKTKESAILGELNAVHYNDVSAFSYDLGRWY